MILYYDLYWNGQLKYRFYNEIKYNFLMLFYHCNRKINIYKCYRFAQSAVPIFLKPLFFEI